MVENAAPTLKAPVIKENTNPAPRLAIPENHQTDMPTLAPRAGGKNNFIDTRNFNPPSSVVVTERRSGCQTIAQNGQLVGGSCNLAARSPRRLRQTPQMRRLVSETVLTANDFIFSEWRV